MNVVGATVGWTVSSSHSIAVGMLLPSSRLGVLVGGTLASRMGQEATKKMSWGRKNVHCCLWVQLRSLARLPNLVAWPGGKLDVRSRRTFVKVYTNS